MTLLGSASEIRIKHLGGVLYYYSFDFKKKREKEKEEKKKPSDGLN
jgi:hypothetical protein